MGGNDRGRAETGVPLRFLWFGSYARGDGYPRSDLLIAALRDLGHEVREVHVPLFDGAGDRVAAGRGGGGARLALRQARAAVKLAAGWFRSHPHDVTVVGSGGLVDTLILRLLQNIDRSPIVLDAFIPLYDTVVRDRGLADPDSRRARTLLRIERLSGRAADLVLSDTAANADLLAEDLRLERESIEVIEVFQCDPGAPEPAPARSGDDPLRVLLFATYIPLHGVGTVVDAARLIGGEGVAVTIIGTGQELAPLEERARGVRGLTLIPEFRPEAEIRERIAASHVGLGVFGDTAKAARVVPLKAAFVASAGRALVTRDGPAARAALDGAALLVAPADPAALAAALCRLRDEPGLAAELGAAARVRYLERFTPQVAAERLVAALRARGLVSAASVGR